MTMVTRLAPLDGLRGTAAMWVLLGHAALLSNFTLPVMLRPDLGVDLFIMLSGFLMVHMYTLRQDREPWGNPGTWVRFWIRRFFRIAPLYYLLLAVALILGAYIYDARLTVDLFRGVTPQLASRYTDLSIANVLMHISFLFGLSPTYSFRTPLPDWSIGLEMQFYLAFPFLMLWISRLGLWTGTISIATGAFLIALFLQHFAIRFPLPAFLPLKMNIFLCGMIAASMPDMRRRNALLSCALIFVLAMLPVIDHDMRRAAMRIILAGALLGLIYLHHLPRILGQGLALPARLLSSRPLICWVSCLSAPI